MPIPAHLLAAARRHAHAGRATALVVRHAERHPVVDLHTHEEVLLTERGHAQALEAGALLADIADHVRVRHSPVRRCGQTAEGLVAGAREAGVRAELLSSVALLGSPFVLDRERAYALVRQIGAGFIRDWFDGKLPHDVFEPRAVAVEKQLAAVVEHLMEPAFHVFVSHDWNIALVREEVLGVSPETRWPAFLDGIAIALDGDDVIVELDGIVVRRPRGLS
jgi:broad specificity phosphatase PhoE